MDEVDELFSQVPSEVLSEEPEASKRSSQDRDSSDGPALPDWLFDNCEASAAKSGSIVGEAPAVNTSSTPARFGPLVSDSDVQGAQQKAIPANTKKQPRGLSTFGRSGANTIVVHANPTLTSLYICFSVSTEHTIPTVLCMPVSDLHA